MKTLTPFVTVVIVSVFLLACSSNREVDEKLDELEKEVANIHPITDEAGYHVVDEQGNIGMQVHRTGLWRSKGSAAVP